MAGETCVHNLRSHGFATVRCDRPAKGTFVTGPYKGKPGCGVHLSAERRVLENDRKAREAMDERATSAVHARERAAHATEVLGVRVEANGEYGRVLWEDLERLAARLAGAIRNA